MARSAGAGRQIESRRVASPSRSDGDRSAIALWLSSYLLSNSFRFDRSGGMPWPTAAAAQPMAGLLASQHRQAFFVAGLRPIVLSLRQAE